MYKFSALFLVFLFCFLYLSPESVEAGVIPTIRGYVYTENKRPIPGVWVAMTNSGCKWCPKCLRGKATRYAKTNEKGEFVFEPVYVADYLQPGGTCESNPAIGRMIDTDFDGVLDAEEIPKAPSGCMDNGARACTYEFGCWGAKYTFSVVKPFNLTGEFSKLTEVDFNNALVDFTIYPGEIIYNPDPPPVSNTPTVSLYPYAKEEPPFPSCLSLNILQFGSGEVCRISQDECKSQNDYTFFSPGGNAVLKIYTGMGHLWDQGCKQGPNNDPQRSGSGGVCDQISQTYEAVKVLVNGVEVGRTVDLGTDVNSYWEFPVVLNNGSNTLSIKHIIAGESLSIESESVFYKGAICAEDSISFVPSSCQVNLPPAISLSVDETRQILPGIESRNGSVDEVTFTLEPLGYASLCSSNLGKCQAGIYTYTDTSPVFGANITGISSGNVRLNVSAKMIDEKVDCVSADSTIQVFSQNAWFQVRNGNVITNSNISVQIPPVCISNPICSPYFITKRGGNSPGLALLSGYYNSNVNVSEKNWLVERLRSFEQVNFEFFESLTRSEGIYQKNLTKSNITQYDLLNSGIQHNGYYYYFYEGPENLNISDDISLGSRKVVLLVKNASLFINGNINFNDGQGFFMAITDKNIYVSPDVYSGINNVPALEGIFVADEGFISGSEDEDFDKQLFVRGTVIAEQLSLQRNLKDNATKPAEFFEFAPDLYMNYPSIFSKKLFLWKEITP
ncbi:MAG: carboxypeptidase-like regulatory domain-containing protein [Patescibacteria group bacterium]|nr:carboxypeptidase-like regulatory domain-containing protein [Patescibacteria group bacterium]